MGFVAVALVTFLIIAVIVLLCSTASFVFGSVSRKRVELFALRQALVITPGNGNVVIRYLATTRRWRGGLLYLVLVTSFGWVVLRAEGNVNLLAGFVGWFVGAVVAEWRVDSLARGPRAEALLHRRRIDDYVRRQVLVLATVVWIAVPALGVCALAATLNRSADRLPAVTTLLAVLVAGTVIALVVRRILERPQPVVAPDLLEADNAIRGRSLNVLVGSALAIGGYLGAVATGEIVARPDSVTVHLAQLIGLAALPILGVLVGRAPRLIPVGVPARSLAS